MAEPTYADIFTRLEQLRADEQARRDSINDRYDKQQETNEAKRSGELNHPGLQTEKQINAKCNGEQTKIEGDRSNDLAATDAYYRQQTRPLEQQLQGVREGKAESEGVMLQSPPPPPPVETAPQQVQAEFATRPDWGNKEVDLRPPPSPIANEVMPDMSPSPVADKFATGAGYLGSAMQGMRDAGSVIGIVAQTMHPTTGLSPDAAALAEFSKPVAGIEQPYGGPSASVSQAPAISSVPEQPAPSSDLDKSFKALASSQEKPKDQTQRYSEEGAKFTESVNNAYDNAQTRSGADLVPPPVASAQGQGNAEFVTPNQARVTSVQADPSKTEDAMLKAPPPPPPKPEETQTSTYQASATFGP